MGVARSVWEAAGYRVRGAALSGIAAEGLEAGSGIESRTLASLERAWAAGVDLLARGDVLVVDEAGMVGSRQMARVLSAVQDAGAKLVLVGDPEQLQAIEAGAAFRAVAERVGSVEITTVRRQSVAWQQEATKELATGRTGAALDRYEVAGMVRGHETLEAARAAVVASWQAGRAGGGASGCRQIMLAHRRVDVRALNEAARSLLLEAGELDRERALSVMTAQGERVFAPGDRVYFLRNDRGLGVKNGTLGTICGLSGDDEVGVVVSVRLDGARAGDEGRVVSVSLRAYDALDHGYAATIHKAQGVTVDRAHVLATSSMDRHSAYVALSRHRETLSVHWARDDVGDRDGLVRRLSRERLKDTTLDYSQEPAQGYARRRGLSVPESRIVLPEVREVVPDPQEIARERAALRDDFRQYQSDQRQALEGRAAFRAAWQSDRLERERQQKAAMWLEGWDRAWSAFRGALARPGKEDVSCAVERERLNAHAAMLVGENSAAWRGYLQREGQRPNEEGRQVLQEILKSSCPQDALHVRMDRIEEGVRMALVRQREAEKERVQENQRQEIRRERTRSIDRSPGRTPW